MLLFKQSFLFQCSQTFYFYTERVAPGMLDEGYSRTKSRGNSEIYFISETKVNCTITLTDNQIPSRSTLRHRAATCVLV